MNELPPPSYFQELGACLQWQAQMLQQLESKVAQLESKVTQLESKVAQMQQQLDALGKQRTMNVEKIEYKFDQLKIEKLDGTLHIGISPELGQSIEDFTANGSPLQFPMTSKQPDTRSRIRDRIDRFLNEECRQLIREREGHYRLVLGSDYVEVMIQDMAGQIDQRISHYMQSVPEGTPSQGIPSYPHSAREDLIVEKIKADITVAIDRHLQTHKKGDDA
ncbi:spore germination protein GerPC [Paenibacillus hodogayensis]|uniref:Spore germination protein GerPC n=1 Tax=Paenibacillus hodogayensis TaxID=279208 RepID=A0ABV5W466_9BACL